MPSVHEPVAAYTAAPVHGQAPLPQDDAGGPVIVDLDEAIFGLNALAREVFGIAQTGIGQAAAHWQAEAASMGLDPLGWISASAYESGWSAIASTIAVSAVSLPFAAMAIQGGIDELRHGRAERQRLRLEKESLMARHARAVAGGDTEGADGADGVGGRNAGEATAVEASALEQGLAHKDAARLKRIDSELSAAKASVSIGAAASCSGSLMSANAVSALVLQPLLKCCAKGVSVAVWVAQHALWSSIVTAVGAIGTLVLSPLAAICATWLGSSFVHRSRIQCGEFLRAKALLLRSLWAADTASASPVSSTPYGRFLTAKLGKRAAFMLRFRNWSAAFLSGAVTYTAGALAKTTLVVGALVGFGLLASNPLILVVLTIAATLGAIMMAAGSLNFILNLGKAKRHESYATTCHPLLDRELLDAMDPVSVAEAGGPQSLADRRGFVARAALYGDMVVQEQAVQGLVASAAALCRKHVAWIDRSAPNASSRHQSTSTRVSLRRDAAAAVGAIGSFAWNLLSGRGPACAWRAATGHFAARRSSLTTRMLADTLPALGPTIVRDQLVAIGRAQIAALKARCEARRLLINGPQLAGEPDEEEASRFEPAPLPGNATHDWLQQQLDRQATDVGLLYDLCELLSAEPDADTVHGDGVVPSTGHSPDAAAAARPVSDDQFIARFLQLQQKMGLSTWCAKPGARPNAGTLWAGLADYLLVHAPKGFATVRGGLLACEMDAARACAAPQA